MDSGLRPVVDSVNAIRVPQDYVTQSGPLREMNGSLGVLAQTAAKCEVAGRCCALCAKTER
ncbi:putative lipoprotein [Escherichia coli]|uniref:Putative lipoprotein n=1 Tax=Escherichia coli TaxID=562 RepID=A0A376VA10_ECOLX|nr:putative lipoprotein [Escherichia coli]